MSVNRGSFAVSRERTYVGVCRRCPRERGRCESAEEGKIAARRESFLRNVGGKARWKL